MSTASRETRCPPIIAHSGLRYHHCVILTWRARKVEVGLHLTTTVVLRTWCFDSHFYFFFSRQVHGNLHSCISHRNSLDYLTPQHRYSSWSLYEFCSPGYEQMLSGQAGDEESLGCSMCLSGSYSDMTNSLQCTYCAFGTYTSNEGETQCHDCPANFYNPYLGASSCLECPYGKTSGATSASCSSCEFTYMLSRNCDVPIMGVLIGVTSVLLFLLFSWYVRL